MNRRQNTNLSIYIQNRGVLPEHVMTKTNEEINTSQDLRYWYKKHGEHISLAELRELCNVVFILKDVVYVSEDMVIEDLIGLKSIKKIFKMYGEIKKRDVEAFLEKGTMIFDVNHFENESVLGMDMDNYIISIVDRFNYERKMNTKIVKAEFLDENDENISDELYEKFFGNLEAPEDEENDEEVELSKYDDKYFELENEYGDLY